MAISDVHVCSTDARRSGESRAVVADRASTCMHAQRPKAELALTLVAANREIAINLDPAETQRQC